MNPDTQVVFLKDHLNFVDEVAGLWHEEWGNESNKNDRERKRLSVVRNAKKDQIPFALIAMIGDELAGSASVFENDLKNRPELGPWLAAVVTKQKYRGMGVAEELTSAVTTECKRLGYTRIYLRTEKADGYFSRLGWKMMHDTIDEKGLPTRVFSKDI